MLLWTLFAGCSVEPPPTEDAGQGLFREGCPVPGQSTARQISDPEARLSGVHSVGTAGDFALFNEHAAFVVTRADADSTYYYYGGVLADAAAVSGCEQTSEDLLQEVGLVVGDLVIDDRSASVLRAFEAQTVEVLSDGSDGGDAVVRATGIDATHWLVEYTMQGDDPSRGFNQTLGLTLTVDYILPPDSQVLQIEIQVQGGEDSPDALLGAALLQFSDELDVRSYASGRVEAAGLGLDLGIPWIVASGGEGALAFAVEGLNLGTLKISGVTIATDIDQGLVSPVVPGDGWESRYAYFVSVGPTDGNSATVPLEAVKDEPTRAGPYTLVPLSGTVRDPAGEPIAGARIDVLTQAPGEEWGVLDAVRSDELGQYTVELPLFADPWGYALQARADGRDRGDPVEILLEDGGVDLELGFRGGVDVSIHEGPLPGPARLDFERSDGWRSWEPVFGETHIDLPPGDYTWTASRGYEFAPVHGTLTVPDDGEGALSADLTRVIDTTGFLSTDTHIHSLPSPDSRVPMLRQLHVAAGHGLEIPMSTDHEIIVGFHETLAASELAGVMGTVGGEEVTASLPEHMTMFPVQPDGTPRGGPVRWFGLDYGELLEAQRDRGGEVILLNHPGWLEKIGWDPLTGEPTFGDPSQLGFSHDARLWDWNFDGMEVVNGFHSPFRDGRGYFHKWQAMLNLGYPITGVGASDDHGGRDTGYPRSYVATSTDDPAAFELDEYVDSFLSGRVLISGGAFMRVSVDGVGLGGLAAPGDLEVRVEALPEVDVDEIIVLANCDEIARIEADDSEGLVKLDTAVPLLLEEDAHVEVVAMGDGQLPRWLGAPHVTWPRAISNPIYVDVDGNGTFDAPGGKDCVDPW